MRSHELVVDIDKTCRPEMIGKTADRMFDLSLFHTYEMLIFSILINYMAVFTLMVKTKKQKRIKHNGNALEYK